MAIGSPFEVSLDCDVCQRRRRTVFFSAIGSPGLCSPTWHEFPGRLLELDFAKQSAHAVFLYRYEPFIDAKHPNEKRYRGLERGSPSWVRFNLTVSCKSCGASLETSTQTNLVRPYTSVCDCGAVLYDDLFAPVLSWERAYSPLDR
jgi:hypothetical protein